MSECVVRMEMPKRCYDCDMADGVNCMATGGVYGREVPKMIWIRRRPDWCPIICSLPEGHGRLGDLDRLEKMVNAARIEAMQKGFDTNPYWLLGDIILQAKTIVQAERSET